MFIQLLAACHLLLWGAVLAPLLLPAGARAQGIDTVRGLRIQQAPAFPAPGTQIITLDGPRPRSPLAVIYLDGRRRDSTNLGSLNPNAIATVSVMKADAARQLGPDEARLGVLIITTKTGQHPPPRPPAAPTNAGQPPGRTTYPPGGVGPVSVTCCGAGRSKAPALSAYDDGSDSPGCGSRGFFD